MLTIFTHTSELSTLKFEVNYQITTPELPSKLSSSNASCASRAAAAAQPASRMAAGPQAQWRNSGLVLDHEQLETSKLTFDKNV